VAAAGARGRTLAHAVRLVHGHEAQAGAGAQLLQPMRGIRCQLRRDVDEAAACGPVTAPRFLVAAGVVCSVDRGGGLASQSGAGCRGSAPRCLPLNSDRALRLPTSEPRAGTGRRGSGPVLPRPRVVSDSRTALRGAQEAGRQAARVKRHDLRVCTHARLGHFRPNSTSTSRNKRLPQESGLQAASPGYGASSNMPREL